MLPQITNYGRYTSDNSGAHTLRLDMDPYHFWYSYQTIIAFRSPRHGFVVSKNVWSVTTGKHLNMIAGHFNERIPNEEFEKLLAECLDDLEFGHENIELSAAGVGNTQ